MSKIKMRCARCSKPFKSSDAKQTLCPDCAAKERLARAKGAVSPAVTTARPVHTPKIIGPGASVLGASAGNAHPAPPPDSGAFGAAARRAEQEERRTRDHRDHRDHGQPTPPSQHHSGPGAREAPPAALQGGAHGKHVGHEHAASGQQGARAAAIATRPPQQPRAPGLPRPPKEVKERKPPLQELTPQQRAQVESRYLELAQPVEFDGIRSRISSELSLPKPLVRKAILELRQRMGLPSWWELQGFPGTPSDLERVRAAYLPLLPVPPIGVHKRIATELGLEPHAVYKGIRQIRGQMGLPQFNPPEQHPEYMQAGASRGGAASADPAGTAAE